MKRLGLLCVCLLWGVRCEQSKGGAYALRVTSRTQLIGGPRALGMVGDYVLANDKIRVLIQDQGWSRGSGIFGGGIIDADRVRDGSGGAFPEEHGGDTFGEFFPSLFLQAFEVGDSKNGAGIEVLASGEDGGPAVIRTRAEGGDFLAMLSMLVDVAIPSSGLRFETDYILKPGASHVEIVGRLINDASIAVTLPSSALDTFLKSAKIDGTLQLPLGDMSLFGADNKAYAPGGVTRSWVDTRVASVKPVGFDLRYSLEETYPKTMRLPAIPGIVVDFLATAGRHGVSYGFAAADSDRNYAWLNKEEYSKDPVASVSKHALVVPFIASGFTGAFYEVPPARLEPKSVYTYTRYFVVGHGDVASVRDEIHAIRTSPTGVFEGDVREAVGGFAEAGAWIHVFDERGCAYTQISADPYGHFKATLEPGQYRYKVTSEGRWPVGGDEGRALEVLEGRTSYVWIDMPVQSVLHVQVTDSAGVKLPAKVSVVSHYDAVWDGLKPDQFLFDLSMAEERLATDFSWHSSVTEKNRAFVQHVFHTSNGFVRKPVKPSLCDDPSCGYDIVVSRGPEYSVYVKRGVVFREGEEVRMEAVLDRVVPTPHFVGADMHIHSGKSADSSMALEDRITTAAAEGLEVAVSTDHNFITDFSPTVKALGVEDFVRGVVGVELTTIEAGHFNAFPVKYTLGPANHMPFLGSCYKKQEKKSNQTALEWVQCTPGQLFDDLRSLGSLGPENTVVQVNHPRDTIMGYFNQYYVDTFDAVPKEPVLSGLSAYIRPQSVTDQFKLAQFNDTYDALEVYNGKRLDLLHTYALPQHVSSEIEAYAQDAACHDGHPANGAGKTLLKKGGQAAFPGAVEDWLHLLNRGKTYTATGNSDSHGEHDEIGYPRTYLYVPPKDGERTDEHLVGLKDQTLVNAVKEHRAVVTNAPFVQVQARVGEAVWGVGSLVSTKSALRGRAVQIETVVRMAPWVDVDTAILYVNGAVRERRALAVTQESAHRVARVVFEHVFDKDAVCVVEVTGSKSLFPVFTPHDETPVELKQVLAAFNSSAVSEIRLPEPLTIGPMTPYALTNPLWFDVDGNGVFDPPGNSDKGPGPAPEAVCPQTASLSRSVQSQSAQALLASPLPDMSAHTSDVRKLFHFCHEH